MVNDVNLEKMKYSFPAMDENEMDGTCEKYQKY